MTEEDLKTLGEDPAYLASWNKKSSDHFRVVSVSGGKDSTALYLWACENFGPTAFSAVFADTGHEHPVTYNYLRNLPEMARGPEIHWVKADFKDRLQNKFNTPESRSEGQQAFIARNHEWVKSRGYTSGNPFLDLIMWKGRVPASKSQFCTEHLKLAPIKQFIEAHRGDKEVVNYVGIRAAESPRRAKMAESEDSKYFDAIIKRPLLRWTEAEVFALLEKHGVPPNPLYAAGFSRVGCFPCIHARKSELARLPDWVWDKLKEWEQIIGRSWFPPGTVPGVVIPTTEQAREWSKTTRGGTQFDMLAPDTADVPSCMSTWGACE